MPTVHQKTDGYYILKNNFGGNPPVVTYQISDAGVIRLQGAGLCYHGAEITETLFSILHDVYKEIYTLKTLNELLAAAKIGQTNRVGTLIDTKISDVNVKGQDGRTALSWAAERGHIDTVAFLMSRRAKVNVEDDFGHDALWWAEFNRQNEIVELLKG